MNVYDDIYNEAFNDELEKCAAKKIVSPFSVLKKKLRPGLDKAYKKDVITSRRFFNEAADDRRNLIKRHSNTLQERTKPTRHRMDRLKKYTDEVQSRVSNKEIDMKNDLSQMKAAKNKNPRYIGNTGEYAYTQSTFSHNKHHPNYLARLGF